MAQSLAVTITVSGTTGMPTGSVILASGSYTSTATALSSGTANITIPSGSLSTGADTLTAKYAPDSGSSSTYNSASGTASVTVTGPTVAVAVNIDALANRHQISPFVYGNNDQTISDISDVGYTYSRWGGNDASNYNWQLQTRNAAADYYFEDYGGAGNQVQLITQTRNAGSHALTTMAMMNWVAQSSGWSYSVKQFGPQCSVDPYNTDAGSGTVAGSTGNCSTSTSPVTTSPVTTAYYPLVDTVKDCPAGTTSGTTCIDRQSWATALATAFGSGTCSVPYSTITSCHFYDMDNEIDIWGGTHRDVHPSPTTYDELQNIYLTEASNMKAWDPQAVRMGWVSCCWYYYWNSAAGNTDKSTHANIDFMPWWLNQIAWNDAVNGARTLDIFDVHAYPETSASGLTTAQAQALALSSTRDWWDPTYTSQAWFGTNSVTTNQPLDTKPFRIPRLRAWANAIYPGTPLSFTEWNFAPSPLTDTDFSTALADVDAYGILGRERMSLASRWTAPSPTNPNYLSLKLFTSYDGAHHGFGTTSVSATHNANPSLFSTYAALNSAGTALTIMVLNKDPANSAQVQFTTTGFTPTNVTTYTLSQSSPTAIVASSPQSWSATQTFAPYTATLLVVSGSMASTPASEWDLNPDTTMVAAGGTVTLAPKIASGSTNVTMSSAVFDSFEGATACSGSLTLTTSAITPIQPGEITVAAGNTPGFCHFTVTGNDSSATQTQGGWIVVGNPAATLAKTLGDAQTGSPGSTLPVPLTVTLTAGTSGGSNTGASILFTTSAGSLSNGTTSGSKIIAVTNSSGVASVTLTLPSTAETVTVTAEGPYGLGHPVATFTETSQ